MEATDLVFRENHTGKNAAGLEAWIGFCVDQSVHADRSIPLGPVDKREDGTVAADADGCDEVCSFDARLEKERRRFGRVGGGFRCGVGVSARLCFVPRRRRGVGRRHGSFREPRDDFVHRAAREKNVAPDDGHRRDGRRGTVRRHRDLPVAEGMVAARDASVPGHRIHHPQIAFFERNTRTAGFRPDARRTELRVAEQEEVLVGHVDEGRARDAFALLRQPDVDANARSREVGGIGKPAVRGDGLRLEGTGEEQPAFVAERDRNPDLDALRRQTFARLQVADRERERFRAAGTEDALPD